MNFDSIISFIENNDIASIDSTIEAKKRQKNFNNIFKAPLMISAHQVKHLQKITQLNTDSIILNLEDGVSPELKPLALRLVAYTLSKLQKCDKKLIVRINPIEEGGDKEILFLNKFFPDAIRVPKVKTKDDVEKILDLTDNSIDIHLSIETKEAWLNMAELKVNKRVKAFYLGILDLFADLGLSQSLITPNNQTIHYMLSHFLITSKSLNIHPVSFVFQDFKNTKLFQEWLDLEKSMGFLSKGCISPTQSNMVMQTFIDNNDIEKAKYIIKIFEENAKNGITGFSDDKYGFIDEPIYKGALVVLNETIH